ncbi:hypothetical protein E3A20_22750, partial [Planctomyces bekefii]
MVSFLRAGGYRNWDVKQSDPIASVPAHANYTQTFFNDEAAISAKAGKFPLPVGSILVKDIFATDKITIRAQALMAKIADGVG